MSTAMSFTQHLPAILLIAGIVLLSLFFLLSIHSKLRRRSAQQDPREFIRRTRESAVDAAATASRNGFDNPSFSSFPNEKSSSKSDSEYASNTTIAVLNAGTPRQTVSQAPHRPLNTEEIVELEATVRRLTAHLDTRSTVLAKLIRDADQRIDEVRAAFEHLPVASISPAKIIPPPPDQTPDPHPSTSSTPYSHQFKTTTPSITPHPQDPAHQRIPPSPVIASIRKSNSTVALTNNDSHDSRPRRRQPPTSPSSPDPLEQPPTQIKNRKLDPLTSSVYELSDRGFGPVSIAQDLDEHVGKVELILALRSA